MSFLLETVLGDVVVDLQTNTAPEAVLTCFMEGMRSGAYHDAVFSRVDKARAVVCHPVDVNKGAMRARRVPVERPRPATGSYERNMVCMLVDEDGTVSGDSVLAFITRTNKSGASGGQWLPVGEVTEGENVVHRIESLPVDTASRPLQNVRIRHVHVLDDPWNGGAPTTVERRTPAVVEHRGKSCDGHARLEDVELLMDGGVDGDGTTTEGEETDKKKKKKKKKEKMGEAEAEAAREARRRAEMLEVMGELPSADVTPPDNVLFVCKLHPVTTSADLKTLFLRFGEVVGCEVVRDRATGASLRYAFVEFETAAQCEKAYFAMDNAIVDDRRIRCDFSQSVAKLRQKYGISMVNNTTSWKSSGPRLTEAARRAAGLGAGPVRGLLEDDDGVDGPVRKRNKRR